MNLYIKWFLLTIVDYITEIVGRILAPFVVPFASAAGWLPSWLSYWQTPDNSLDGDGGWQNEHWQWRFKFSPRVATYLGRVGWLWRNNMYGFAIDVMGAKVLSTDTLVVTGDLKTSDRPAHSGSVKREIYRDGSLVYFQWYYIKTYSLFGIKRNIRLNFGWKLWGFDQTDKNLQFTAYINPVKGGTFL